MNSKRKKMDVLNELNEACAGTTKKKYYNWDDLALGNHAVDHFELVDRFGLKLIVVLENGMDLQMPDRVFKKFNQQAQVDKLNLNKHVLDYRGKDSKLSNKLILHFQKVTGGEVNEGAKRAGNEVNEGAKRVGDKVNEGAKRAKLSEKE